MEFKLEVVIVPVTDVDRAKAFYADLVGFTLDLDVTPGPGMRVVQLTPRGSGCSVVIGSGVTTMEPGSLKGVYLCVADVDAAQALLAERGVQVSPVQHYEGSGFADGRGGDWNSWCFFDDPDGNSWSVQESPTMRAAVGA